MSITTYVWKIASRCNLNCRYCYVYHAADTSWRGQPGYMTLGVAEAAARKIRLHCESRGIRSININFHGGEPLLAGMSRLQLYIEAIRKAFNESSIEVNSSIQSNGLLLDNATCKWLATNAIGLYLSVDGPPQLNDRWRLDQLGRPTGQKLEERIRALIASEYRSIFQGFLVVVDPSFSARAVFDYIAQFNPPAVDFLFPLLNHDTWDGREYGQWLIECFDYWFDGNSGIRARTFEQYIVRLLLPDNSDEAAPIDALVIETDGSYELDDTLKTAYSGATKLGLNVVDHSVKEVIESAVFRDSCERFRPAKQCEACQFFTACRGGHISQRYSCDRGFDNVNVYCEEFKTLISHISKRLNRQLATFSRTKHAEQPRIDA
ncbi:radical SAM protein (plasmid) [Paraburkholderia sp. PREW-6R]|uniref:radical SAM protein n=1 Tax=Paraburkholderia sp. PREW-6R TaxID=3141544 RepID=UPI0031F5174F